MNIRKIFAGLLLTLAVSSCIQDEALNVEAAIDDCTGENIQLASIDATHKEIEIYVLDGTDVSQQELNFTLADGATIQADETEADDQPPYYDFSQRTLRRFTVTSEDGNTTATYVVRINKMELPTHYSFENLRATTPYHIFYLTNESGIMQWASGNPGYELSGMALDETQYPTVQAPIGHSGKCVRLTTRSTGSFGLPLGMPIACGNLFVGSFDVQNAVTAPRQATHFGFPFTKIPQRITGWYKYQKGETFTDENNEVLSGQTDIGDIYAVLYEAETSDYTLDGDLFPLTGGINPNIVLMARIGEQGQQEMKETDEWTYFDLSFEAQNGKTVDPEGLANGKYKLAIAFASSRGGGYFRGAVGSELYIDEVEIICE